MSRIVITGGAGFIGSQLGHSLYQDGHDVILVDDMSFGYEDNLVVDGSRFGEFVEDDVRSSSMNDVLKGADYVFHFAGISSLPVCQQDPYRAFDVNVGGTVNILECARRNGVKRLVFASTSAIYENNTRYPCWESDKVDPDLVYAMSKLQAEMVCRSYFKNYDFNVVVLRYYNVYGPHQDYRRKSPPFVGYVLKELLDGNTPVLHSDGTQKRDYVYVDDVNSLNKLCMVHPSASGEVFNVASGDCYSVNEIYDILSGLMETEIEPIFEEASSFWNRYEELFSGPYPFSRSRVEKEVNKFTLGANWKASKLLGWSSEVSIYDGMKSIVQYIKNDRGGV